MRKTLKKYYTTIPAFTIVRKKITNKQAMENYLNSFGRLIDNKHMIVTGEHLSPEELKRQIDARRKEVKKDFPKYEKQI